jgi:hypothetical protein
MNLGGISDRLRRRRQESVPPFDFGRDYLFQDELYGFEGRPPMPAEAGPAPSTNEGAAGAEPAQTYRRAHHGPQWALLRFEHPVTAPAVRGVCLSVPPRCASCALCFLPVLAASGGALRISFFNCNGKRDPMHGCQVRTKIPIVLAE